MEKVITIVGPTAVGKTKLSIEIAKNFNGEIISGDSMQVYKGMDIGTAKVTPEEMQGIPHYMIDITEPGTDFTVAEFKREVTNYIKKIHAKDKLPIIVGGSGLYIQSILYQYDFLEHKRDEQITKKLEQELVTFGTEALHTQLKEIDPTQANQIHPNNHRRLIRALEIYQSSGMTMTEYLKNQELNTKEAYDSTIIGLDMEREILYDRINMRVDSMMHQGLLDEVQALYEAGLQNSQAMKAIGYKEFIPYFQGESSLEECIIQLKQNSRRFAKRQFTWFKNRMNVKWYQITPKTINNNFNVILQDLAGIL